MKLADFEALSFDCYGTLIDWKAGLSAVLVPWAAERGLTLTAEQLLTEYAGLEAAVEAEGLGATFAGVITAQDVGSYKPSPRNFDALAAEAARLRIGPGRLLHVAQSLFHDHLPAKQAGLPTVWINRRHDRPGWGATPAPPAPVAPDWEFPSMAAFAAGADSA
ncbi:MAG: hypothetical protein ACRDOU_15910 [Streptosporangiaceae bacterium]